MVALEEIGVSEQEWLQRMAPYMFKDEKRVRESGWFGFFWKEEAAGGRERKRVRKGEREKIINGGCWRPF